MDKIGCGGLFGCSSSQRRAIFAFLTALVVTGCGTTASPGPMISQTVFGESSSTTIQPQSGTRVLTHAAQVFANDLAKSAADPINAPLGQAAFVSGRSLLDLICSDYLDALGTANQAAANQRQQLSLIGGFAAAIMGITGSPAKQIAAVSTTFGFAGASMDAFTTSFLFSDAATSVTKLVRQSQRTYVEAIRSDIATLDYAGAVNLLTGYEQTCRPAQIRALIDEAIAKATIVADSPGELPVDAEIVQLTGALAGILQREIAEADAVVLYTWFRGDATTRKDLADRYPLVKRVADSKDLTARIELQFVKLHKDHALARRWESLAASLRSRAAASDSPPAANAPVKLAVPPSLITAPILRVR